MGLSDTPGLIPRRALILRALGRALLASLCSAMVVSLAVVGVYSTTASRNVSLVLGPLSLFLMPGFVVSVVLSNLRDYPPLLVAIYSLCFYFAFFYTAFWWLAERRERRRLARLAQAPSQNPQRSR